MNALIYQHFHAWKGVADCINPLLGVWLLAAVIGWRSAAVTEENGWSRNDFLWRSVAAIVVVFVIGHLNRWLHLWPEHRMFPSGHVGFSVCVAMALGLWNRKSWIVLLPLLLFQAWLMIALRFHSWLDIIGAVILASVVSWLFWRPKTKSLAVSTTSL